MKIAFLGLGNMGSGMAARLLRAGYPLHVWNRSPEKAAPLAALGATVEGTPESAVAGAEVIISSLMDDASMRTVFVRSGRLFAAMAPAAVHLCVTTISPACADWLEAMHKTYGSHFVSGPVVGRPDSAKAGTLTQLMAGDAAAMDRVEPLAKAYAQRVIRLPGPASTANKQKLCINFFVASIIEALGESYTLAEKIGASKEMLADFYKHCFAHPALKQYCDRLFERKTGEEAGFSMAGGYKDVSLMLDMARDANCPLELGEVIAAKMKAALDQGMAETDWSSTQEITRQRAGLG